MIRPRSGYTPKMAAGMWGSNSPLMSGAQPAQAHSASELREVFTSEVGFRSLSGDIKLRILPAPWPDDAQPPPTASLLSVASRAGILAAADPSTLIIAKLSDIRAALQSKEGVNDSVKNFSSSLKIPLPLRVSQVAFTFDEKYLIICAENGGGLQVYETAALLKENTQHAFQIGTQNISVRALAPNPVQDSLVAVVLSDGKLTIANLDTRNLQNTANGGPLLKDAGVTSCSWSAKGKQLVAGLEDGSALQLRPDGATTAAIPKPPGIDKCYVSSMFWLDNDRFLNIYGKEASEADPNPATVLVTRRGEQFEFQRFATEPCMPLSDKRVPPHYFINRLRNYDPSLKDSLFVISTCSPDIDLIANSAARLSQEPSESVNTYALVVQEEDTRKAGMHSTISDSMNEPSALGMAFDLSSNEPVKRPIPKEETLEQTSMPLPALMLLNDEGVLSAWWFIYNAAILQNVTYKGMNSVQGTQPNQQSPTTTTPSAPAFGQPGLSSIKTPSTGTAQPLGLGQSPWSSSQPQQPSFGQPSFGQPSFGTPSKPAFGSPAPLGSNQKLFGSGGGTQANASPFAKPTNQNDDSSKTSPFGALAKNNTSSSPFANVSKTTESSLFGGKSALGENKTSSFATMGETQASQWAFGQPEKKEDKPTSLQQQPSFGSTMTIGSSFGYGSAPSGVNSLWGTPSLSNKTSDGVNPTAGRPSQVQDDDADMDMDKKAESAFNTGLSGLGLGGQNQGKVDDVQTPIAAKPEKGQEKEPRQQPAEETNPPKEPTPEAAPLPPDPFSARPPKLQSPQKKSDEPPLPPSPKPEKAEQLEKARERPESIQPSKGAEDEQTNIVNDGKERSKTPPLPESPTERAALTAEEQPKSEKASPKEEEKTQELSPVGSEPEIVEAERSIPASPTKSITSDANETQDLTRDITQNLDRGGTWPRSKSPVHPTPSKPSLFGEQTPSATFSFTDKTPTSTLPKPPVFFQRPDDSPRSPSPIRQQAPPTRRKASPVRRTGSGLSPTRSPAQSPDRAVSSPAPTFVPTPRPQHGYRPSGLQHEIPPTGSSPAPSQTPSQRTAPTPARAPSPVPSVDFSSAEDAENRVQEELSTHIKPTTKLKAFLAQTNYVDENTGTSFASQIERLYRDGNSMVDTLGLNARTLHAFIQGHEELYKQGERDVEDLEPEHHKGWTMDEIDHLVVLQKQLAERLQANRPQDVKDTLLGLRDIHRETIEMRSKQGDIARQVADIRSFTSGVDPSTRGGRARGKLSAQQAAVLRDLRKQFANVRSLLAHAEDALSLFRAKVVAQEAQNQGPSAGAAREVPTYEAVMNTIAKMTRMAEEKRGNVDLLEARLKRLKKSGVLGGGNSEDLGMNQLSLGSSPRRSGRFSTPSTGIRSSRLGNRTRSGYGFNYSDEDSDNEAGDGVMVKRANSEEDEDLARSTKALAINGQNREVILSDLSDAALEEVRKREANRKKALRMFRNFVVERGVKVTDKTNG